MYDPTVGRFITEDPIGFDGGDTNLYRYVGSSPTNATDPTGEADYRGTFAGATPAMPKDWQVHHMAQQIDRIAERFLAERNIDVNALPNLRGISQPMHTEISAIQRKFWAQQANKYGSYAAAYDKTPLSEVEGLNSAIEETYGPFMLKAGGTLEEIKDIASRLPGAESRIVGKAQRINGVLAKVGVSLGALGVFGLFWTNATLAKNIVAPSARVRAALDDLLSVYGVCYDEALNGTLTAAKFSVLHDKLSEYMNAAGLDGRVQSAINEAFTWKWADMANNGPGPSAASSFGEYWFEHTMDMYEWGTAHGYTISQIDSMLQYEWEEEEMSYWLGGD